MATVTRHVSPVNRRTASPATGTATTLLAAARQHAAQSAGQSHGRPTGGKPIATRKPSRALLIAWHAIGRVANKEADRDDLAGGSSHVVSLNVSGTVDGEPFEQAVNAQRAASGGVDLGQVERADPQRDSSRTARSLRGQRLRVAGRR